MTRREANLTFPITLATVLTGGAASILDAQAPSTQPNSQDHMRHAMSHSIQTLIREPLAKMTKPVVAMITLTLPPGAHSSPHKHTGPVFAYILEGEIENQVDPEAPKKFKPGEFFYEPPMHVHRMMRNLSTTQIAKLLIVEVEEEGVAFTVGAS